MQFSNHQSTHGRLYFPKPLLYLLRSYNTPYPWYTNLNNSKTTRTNVYFDTLTFSKKSYYKFKEEKR